MPVDLRLDLSEQAGLRGAQGGRAVLAGLPVATEEAVLAFAVDEMGRDFSITVRQQVHTEVLPDTKDE
jgi:hypothetical protein